LAAEKGNLNAQNKIKSFPTQVSTSLEKLPTKVTYAADIQFESNSSLFTNTILEDFIVKAKSINLDVIVILAHARSDEIDPLKLSVIRADAIKSLLVSSGISPQRIHVEAKGSSTIAKSVVEVEIIGTRKN
jgi:outer membrane protein OmpA-like peptidoglycan-associated protein